MNPAWILASKVARRDCSAHVYLKQFPASESDRKECQAREFFMLEKALVRLVKIFMTEFTLLLRRNSTI